MKIVHTASGKAYQLNPGTQLEVERPNLFFNEYGEQTLPVDLPDTDLNRELTGYPDLLANHKRPHADIDCTIQDGDYFMACRQAILGAKRKEKITTSFYMNEGSFLSRIENVSVASIFGDEVVPGVTTVQQGIDWCWSLRDNRDENFAIFPMAVDLDGAKRGVNIVCPMSAGGVPKPGYNFTVSNRPTAGGRFVYGFYNSYPRKEKVDGRTITLAPGYYLTPFIRARYLLKRIFAYFGYELQDNFFSEVEPFRSMVFVNNTIDSLVNGTILMAHLVPDCLCGTILELYRKKFCCEFVPNEADRTVKIVFFKDVIAATSRVDLSEKLVGYPEISYQMPRQLKLSSRTSLTEGSSYESTSEMLSKCPTTYCAIDNRYYRYGYGQGSIIELVSDGNIPYYAAEEGFEDYEVEVPDCQFSMCDLVYHVPDQERQEESTANVVYVGEGRTLNSTIEGAGIEEEDEDAPDQYLTATSHDQEPCLAFVHSGTNYCYGSNCDAINGYSLLYNGPIGIYERFYRDFDNLLRNALHEVNVELLLANSEKRNLPVHEKVTLQGNAYLFNVLKFTVGGKNVPVETSLFTTLLQEPVSLSMNEAVRMPEAEYRWRVSVDTAESLTEEQWVEAGFEPATKVDYPVLYLPAPTAAQYAAGGKYHVRTEYCSSEGRDGESWIYMRQTTSLTPEKVVL